MKKKWALAFLCLINSFLVQSQQVAVTESTNGNNNYLIEDSVLIRTKDGAFVAARVCRKQGVVSPLPVILQFTIYARATDSRKIKEAADRGYVGVMAYTRGKWNSPGKAVPYEYDGKDLFDVIDWISKQPWCNGKIGMYGGSYNGFTQWAAAKHLHPALKTIVPSAAVAPGLDVPMMNNVFMSFPFSWTYYVSNNKFLDTADYNNPQWNELNEKWFSMGLSYRLLDSLTGRPANKTFRNWLAHPTYDAYWQQMIPYKKDFSNINIPVLTTTGYYDGGQVGALYYLREHYRFNKKANHYLLIGPYGHFGSQGYPDSIYYGYKIDAAANINIHNIIYDWFDYILKGGEKPAILKDRINYQVMGTNEWKHASSPGNMNNKTIRFYLDNRREGSLNPQKPAVNEYTDQEVDFADRNSRNNYYYANNIIYDSLFARGGLMFISDPLKEETELAGCFSGKLEVAINKKDMDFSAALFELMPDGRYFYLSYFMGRASYVGSNRVRKLLMPGKKTTLPFSNSYFTSKKLSKGSRVVVIMNVNKSPFEQINYGTGKDVSSETVNDAKEPLKIKWYNDGYIELPVRQM